MKLTTAILATILVAAAQTRDGADSLLKGAQNAELVDGNLSAAIKQYRAIATKYASSDRGVAATALVRMADCYRKMGDAESRKIYERVLREYSDQPEAMALARAGLNAASAPMGPVAKRVWNGPKADSDGGVSPDGRYISYVDWTTGDLAIHDIASGSERLLTNKGNWNQSREFAEESVISRDGHRIAYAWFNGSDRYEIRLADLTGTGVPQARRIFDDPNVVWIAPYDWSPDGKLLAVMLQRKDRRIEIGAVSTTHGSLRSLKTVERPAGSMSPIGMFFSPDGRQLGFDIGAADNRLQHDVFAIQLDGGAENCIVSGPAQDWMMGWSPDGKRLLYASDRSGSVGLWSVPVTNGKAQGPPELLKRDIGNSKSLGVTRAGALYYAPLGSNSEIAVASFDFATGKMLAPPADPVQGYVGNNIQPAWSADGKWLAWVSTRGPIGRDRAIGIRDTESGREREIHPQLTVFNNPAWAPDGRTFVVQGQDGVGRQGIFRIDAQTGATTPVVLSDGRGGLSLPRWSADGSKIYYRRQLKPPDPQTREGDFALYERELGSSAEVEIGRCPRTLGGPILSPDGSMIVTAATVSETKDVSITLSRIRGGEPRELLQIKAPDSLHGMLSWTPDGHGILVPRTGAAAEMWIVPISGGEPRKLELKTTTAGGNRGISIHPDGRRMAFVESLEGKQEVWSLENFLTPTREGLSLQE